MKIENGKKYMFNTTDTGFTKYNGTEVEVIRLLTEDEADIFDVGNMYKVRFADGYERDAFEDELSRIMTQKQIYCMGRAEYLAEYEGYSLIEGYKIAEKEWDERN